MIFSAGYKSKGFGEKGVVHVYIKVRPAGAPSVGWEQDDMTGYKFKSGCVRSTTPVDVRQLRSCWAAAAFQL